MPEIPDGRRSTRTWTEWATLAAPWASILIAIERIFEDWVLPHL
ncbi:hypothetical protein ACN2WE_14085 [Streptomyces sp. cg28]